MRERAVIPEDLIAPASSLLKETRELSLRRRRSLPWPYSPTRTSPQTSPELHRAKNLYIMRILTLPPPLRAPPATLQTGRL